MKIDPSNIMKLVLRNPSGDATTAVTASSIRKDRSSFYGDLILNVKLWWPSLFFTTVVWILISASLVFIDGYFSWFGKSATEGSPQGFWDIVYYVAINVLGGFDDYHPYSLIVRLLTVANIIFGLIIFGMIVAICTSAMEADTEISLKQPGDLTGEVEFPKIGELTDKQEILITEIGKKFHEIQKDINDLKTIGSDRRELRDIRELLSRNYPSMNYEREKEEIFSRLRAALHELLKIRFFYSRDYRPIHSEREQDQLFRHLDDVLFRIEKMLDRLS